jgi:DNA-binding GntR family transcriptional regulator
MSSLQYKLLKKQMKMGSIDGVSSLLHEDHNPLRGKAGRIFYTMERRFAAGFYKFGEDISVTKLVEEFGASRAPVTTALNFLRADGYLIITPQVGCRVINPSKEEILDFFMMFGKMEGTMAALAAQRHTPEHIALLRDIEDKIRRATPTGEEKILDQFVELLAVFHELIREMANSPRLASRMVTFWNMSEFLLWNGAKKSLTDKLKISNDERRAILDAIASRQSEKAEALMEAHILGKPGRIGVV